MVYLIRDLARTLLRLAREREPEAVSIGLSVTSAGDIDGADLPPETPVFTHFYLPTAGGSVNAVFGVELGTPPGQTQGRFLSHPTGELSVSKTDDLAEVVFVAVPPWEPDSMGAFDRRGRRRELTFVDAEPPRETPPE